jgi:hypothetical protein
VVVIIARPADDAVCIATAATGKAGAGNHRVVRTGHTLLPSGNGRPGYPVLTIFF